MTTRRRTGYSPLSRIRLYMIRETSLGKAEGEQLPSGKTPSWAATFLRADTSDRACSISDRDRLRALGRLSVL